MTCRNGTTIMSQTRARRLAVISVAASHGIPSFTQETTQQRKKQVRQATKEGSHKVKQRVTPTNKECSAKRQSGANAFPSSADDANKRTETLTFREPNRKTNQKKVNRKQYTQWRLECPSLSPTILSPEFLHCCIQQPGLATLPRPMSPPSPFSPSPASRRR